MHENTEVPEPGVVASFPVPDGGAPFQIGYDEAGVWCGRPGLSTFNGDAERAQAILQAYAAAVTGHRQWFAEGATVVSLSQHRER